MTKYYKCDVMVNDKQNFLDPMLEKEKGEGSGSHYSFKFTPLITVAYNAKFMIHLKV